MRDNTRRARTKHTALVAENEWMKRPRIPAGAPGSKVAKKVAKVLGHAAYEPFHGGELTRASKKRSMLRLERRLQRSGHTIAHTSQFKGATA